MMGNGQGIIGFFEEQSGQKSMIRLMSFMCLVFAFFVITYILVADTHQLIRGGQVMGFDQNINWVLGMLLMGAFCPKVIQKYFEKKFELPADKP